MLEERLVGRIHQLIEMAAPLSGGSGGNPHVTNVTDRATCAAWLGTAFNAICMACASEGHPYRQAYQRAVDQWPRDHTIHLCVGAVAGLLGHLIEDARQGLLTSVADNACAETFDDLLDHAAEYHRLKRKEGSGILATAVFEDTLRRIVQPHALDGERKKLDQVISTLVKEDVITGIVSKRCRTAAGVRNAALHADWEAFTLGDVEDVIKLTRQLLEEHLAA